MATKNITMQELKSQLEQKNDFLLLDLMNPEFYGQEHIPGALNAPIYEVVFLDNVAKLASDKKTRIVVYDDNNQSFAKIDAASKLALAGYENVEILEGNLSEWKKMGYPLETGESLNFPELVDGKFVLDGEKSLVGWTGRNAKYAHRGIIKGVAGEIIMEKENLVGGKIVLDMQTIVDEDLTDDTWRLVLEKHLKSSDFFEVEKFPEASFEIKKAEKIAGAKSGTPNYKLSGELTIKGITNEVEFLAMVTLMEDGTLNGQAHFDFDRTLWNVRYGSEKFFQKLGMHLVNDLVSLEMFLVAKPAEK